MTRSLKIIAIVCLIIMCFGCTSTHVVKSYDIRSTINQIEALHNEANKGHRSYLYPKVIPVVQFKPFDVNKYFSILNHIHPPEGYVLDYVFFKYSSISILYLRTKQSPSFNTYEDFVKTVENSSSSHYRKDVLANLEIDGSPESYLELLIFYKRAGRFHLPPKSYPYPPDYISTDRELESAINRYKGRGKYSPTEEQIGIARQLSPSPVVEFSDNENVKVRLLDFSCRPGFIRYCYNIMKDPPHKVTDCKPEVYTDFDCGIIFD